MGFWQDLGSHVKGMGEGFVSIFQGIGANIGANAAYTQSAAALNTAQAANLPLILAQQREQQQQADEQAKILLAILIAVPILIILALLIINRKHKT